MSDTFTATDENEPRALEVHLGYWLRRVSNQVSGAFAQALQQRQVSVAEWAALQHIQSQQNITPGMLAARLGMTRGAISKILDKLEEKAWVERAANPKDDRVQWLGLTPQARDVLPELTKIADRNDETFFGPLDAQERAVLRELLEKLTRLHQINDTPVY